MRNVRILVPAHAFGARRFQLASNEFFRIPHSEIRVQLVPLSPRTFVRPCPRFRSRKEPCTLAVRSYLAFEDLVRTVKARRDDF